MNQPGRVDKYVMLALCASAGVSLLGFMYLRKTAPVAINYTTNDTNLTTEDITQAINKALTLHERKRAIQRLPLEVRQGHITRGTAKPIII